MAGGILWLASYPKSGSAWLWALLANYPADGEAPLSPNEIARFSTGDNLLTHYEGLADKPASGLSEAQVGRIISANAAIMRKFGYLDEEGNVIDRPASRVPQ